MGSGGSGPGASGGGGYQSGSAAGDPLGAGMRAVGIGTRIGDSGGGRSPGLSGESRPYTIPKSIYTGQSRPTYDTRSSGGAESSPLPTTYTYNIVRNPTTGYGMIVATPPVSTNTGSRSRPERK
jgi:hypothetical protein